MSDPTTSAPANDHGTAPASAPANNNDGADGFEARLAALQSGDDGEAAPEPAAEEAPAPPAAAAADSDAASRAAERRARLAAMQETLRKQVDSKRRQNEAHDYARNYEEAQRRAQELEAAAAKRIDPASLDEAGFFKLANQLNISPQRLGEWIRDATLNPEQAAAAAAKQALDPRIAAAEERAAKAEALVQEFIAEQQRAQAAHYEAQQRAAFVQSIAAEEAPHAAKFIASFGADEFLKIADSASRGLPDNAGRQALLDVIEENLERLAQVFMPTSSAPSSNGKQLPHVQPAAAKATTVSNSVAQERASVVEDDDWASLPFEVRLERMKASA